MVLLGACAEEPDEMRAGLQNGSAEPQETRGAPYPPAEPTDRVPNVDDQEEWPAVPDGPAVGDVQPANSAVELREAETQDGNDVQ